MADLAKLKAKMKELREEDKVDLPEGHEEQIEANGGYLDVPISRFLNVDESMYIGAYADTLSHLEARKQLGWSKERADRVAALPEVAKEIREVERAYSAKWRMTAMATAGKHVELMQKMEQKFDAGETSMANPLAKMSGDALKATGWGQEKSTSVAPVTVNISIGSSEEAKNVTVEAEAVVAEGANE